MPNQNVVPLCLPKENRRKTNANMDDLSSSISLGYSDPYQGIPNTAYTTKSK